MKNLFLSSRFIFINAENGREIFKKTLESFKNPGGEDAISETPCPEITEGIEGVRELLQDAAADLEGMMIQDSFVCNPEEEMALPNTNQPLSPEEQVIFDSVVGPDDQAELEIGNSVN